MSKVNGNHTTNGEGTGSIPAWVNPDLDKLLIVRKGSPEDGDFRSSAESLVDLPRGSLFARVNQITPKERASYTTVQAGIDLHIELNSDLVYMNHSCDPTMVIDTDRMEIRVAPNRDLKKGEPLTFFYPTTEWTMAQPFDCWCGAGDGKCVGRVSGARDMDPEVLKRYWLTSHIEELLQREEEAKR